MRFDSFRVRSEPVDTFASSRRTLGHLLDRLHVIFRPIEEEERGVARSGISYDPVLPLDLLLRVQSSSNDQSREAEKKSGKSSEPSGLRDVVGVQLE